MLDKLIESTDNSMYRRRLRRMFASIGTAMTGLFVAGLVFSIFSTNLAMGNQVIDLSQLVAPAIMPESAPPQPEKQASNKNSDKTEVASLPIRVQNIQSLNEQPTKIPVTVSTTPGKFRARPPGAILIDASGDRDGSTGNAPGGSPRGGGSLEGTGFNIPKGNTERVPAKVETVKTVSPPPQLSTKLPPQSGGVVNGNAIDLVMPVRSSTAVSIGAKGPVRVSVLISETGKVVSASALSGHAMLRDAAVAAALRSKFNPTLLSGQPVKVSGVILYNFN